MALRNLRYFNDELLRKKSKQINVITKNIKILLDDMADTMAHFDGVGIAAPQVGILKQAVLVAYEDTIYEMINPEIYDEEGLQSGDEGCLSIPGKVGTVERPEKLTVKYLNRDGEEIVLEAEGTLAVIISHEVDHLNGILYSDKALPDTFRDKTEDAEDEDEEYEEGEDA